MPSDASLDRSPKRLPDILPSRTEAIVGNSACWIEFDLTQSIGYQELRGLFLENGPFALLCSGYMIQSIEDPLISQTPVQLHLFSHGIYLAAPGEEREFYVHAAVNELRLARLYFSAPTDRPANALDGYKPPLETFLALDLHWRSEQDHHPRILTLFYEADFQSDVRPYVFRRITPAHTTH